MYFFHANHQMFEQNKLEAEFVGIYKTVFSGAPFYEDFSDEEIRAALTKYLLPESCLIIAIKDDSMIGYGASMPVRFCSKTIKDILSKHVDIETAVFNADLAVLPDYRRHGIGSKLIELRNQQAVLSGAKHIAMRTNKYGSYSRGLYDRLGFLALKETMWVKQKRSKPGIPEKDERVILVRQAHAQKSAMP